MSKEPKTAKVQADMQPGDIVPDSEARGMMVHLPEKMRDFVQLARFDRPIGWWLLFWPGAWAIALAGNGLEHWPVMLWFLLGSIAMRGAGCVWNDIVDRDLDRKVARTASRPVASGRVSVKAAMLWLGALCLVGLGVLLQLGGQAQMMASASMGLVAAYPFMKRITWWPQVWLGLVFSWAALVGWVEMQETMNVSGALLYAGCICWVVGYDSIYALQDREDDALVGIRSSALAMGGRVRDGVAGFYTAATVLWAGAIWLARPEPLALVALLPVSVHLFWQVVALRADGANALNIFRSNRFAGLLMFAACGVVGGS